MEWVKKEPKIKYNEKDDIITKLAKINGIDNVNTFLNPSEKSLK